MRYVWPLLLLPLLTGCRFTFHDGYAFDFKGSQATRTDSGPISEEVKTIQVDNRFGNVQIAPALNGDAMWTWDLTVWSSSSEEADAWSKQITLQQDVSVDSAAWILVLPETPARGLRGVESNLTLSVPPSVEVRINNRGNVDLRDLEGKVEVRNRHGDVAVKDTAGITDITNEHGRIAADRIGPATINSRHGSARLSQVSGDLKMQSQHADVEVIEVGGEAALEGQHGDLEVRDVAGLVRISNQHGSIKVRGAPGPVRLENQHGPIQLEANSVDVECRNQHGEIKLVLTSRELQRLQVEGSHSSIHAVLPRSIDSVRVDVEHGNVSSALPQVEDSAFSFQSRHGDVRIERAAD